MVLLKKKEKPEKKVKEKEPQYYISATNIKSYNYNVYYMKLIEKLIYFIISFLVGAIVAYLFYGGIGVDEFGEPTKITWILNITIPTIVGSIAGFYFIPLRTSQIIKKQKTQLKNQFRDFLEAFNTSIGAGKNVVDSFCSVFDDLKVQYDENSYILKELEIIISGIANNILVEDLLVDFGNRSGIEDIKNFANVFNICYRKGGNIKDTIRSTHEILSDKMEILDDIETVVTSSKLEQNIMIVMPIVLIAMMKSMSQEFAANFVTTTGIISTTIAVILFVASYVIGRIVLDIKV